MIMFIVLYIWFKFFNDFFKNLNGTKWSLIIFKSLVRVSKGRYPSAIRPAERPRVVNLRKG
jgi:hypothetical protein